MTCTAAHTVPVGSLLARGLVAVHVAVAAFVLVPLYAGMFKLLHVSLPASTQHCGDGVCGEQAQAHCAVMQHVLTIKTRVPAQGFVRMCHQILGYTKASWHICRTIPSSTWLNQ